MRIVTVLGTILVAACAAAVVWAGGVGPAVNGANVLLASLALKQPATPDEWRTAYLGDLNFLHTLIRDNHPVAVDPLNPAGRAWVEEGFEQGKGRAGEVKNSAGYLYGLRAYINGFKDPHTAIGPAFKPLPALEWPGFLVAERDGAPRVIVRDESDPSAPPQGARIVACDGETIEALTARIVYPFLHNERLHAGRLRAVTQTFLSDGNPFARRPATCELETAAGRTTLTLAWRAMPEAMQEARRTANFGHPAAWGVSEPQPGVVWIGIPSFGTDNDTSAHLNAVIGEVESKAALWRTTKSAIVFDVRGNGGGSSAWGDRIAAAIWGAQKEGPDTTAVDWRASASNADYLTAVRDEMQKNGALTPDLRAWFDDAIPRIRAAAAKGAPYAREGAATPGPEGGLTRRRPQGPSPFKATVVFFNDGACGSACADFADRVLHHPGVVHAGYWTSGDGVYMEGRRETAPSGSANIFFAMKVYRGRARGHLEEYEPDWFYNGDWSEAAVKTWLTARLNAQPR